MNCPSGRLPASRRPPTPPVAFSRYRWTTTRRSSSPSSPRLRCGSGIPAVSERPCPPRGVILHIREEAREIPRSDPSPKKGPRSNLKVAICPRDLGLELGISRASIIDGERAHISADFPQGPRPQGRRRRRARRALPQRLVDDVKRRRLPPAAGRLTVHLAREFGFCYGVDRAVDYAYQARKRFPGPARLPDRRDHPQPPRQRSAARPRHPLPRAIPAKRRRDLGADDVVILPAFGVTVERDARAPTRGCTLVDTTCGSVLNVWKNVRATRRTASPRSSTARCSTRKRAPPRRRR